MKITKLLIKKLTSVVLSVSMLSFCVGATTASAFDDGANSSRDEATLNARIYDRIASDYLLQTKLTAEQADDLFDEINAGDSIYSILNSTAKTITSIDNNDDYAENVLFIQDNYDVITEGMDVSEKYNIDKYFLAGAIQYYKDFSDATEFDDSTYTDLNNENTPLEPISTQVNSGYNTEIKEKALELQNSSREDTVAQVRIFADSTGQSSIINTSGHAWLTVKNVSNSNITVGSFSIAPNMSLSIGTWGNTDEHHGLWYDLEAYHVYHSNAWSSRASLLVNIGPSALSTLTNYILNHDSWSLTNNCSSFAVGGWNLICSTTLSAGVINTPTNLKNSIINTGLSSTGVAVPYNYIVYYANGSNTPTASQVFV